MENKPTSMFVKTDKNAKEDCLSLLAQRRNNKMQQLSDIKVEEYGAIFPMPSNI